MTDIAEFRVDDRVDLNREWGVVHGTTNGLSSRARDELFTNGPYRITRLSRNYAWVRILGGGLYGDDTTVQLDRRALLPEDRNRPRPRRLGETPVEEGKEFIDVKDPRIQWLWEDMGKYATDQGWCPEYDALAARLGIPGRPRNFTARVNVGTMELQAIIEARSQREANEELARRLREQQAEPVAA